MNLFVSLHTARYWLVNLPWHSKCAFQLSPPPTAEIVSRLRNASSRAQQILGKQLTGRRHGASTCAGFVGCTKGTHPFQLATRLVLLIELVLEYVAIGLQLNEAVFVFSIEQVQFPLELVFLLFEQLNLGAVSRVVMHIQVIFEFCLRSRNKSHSFCAEGEENDH